MSGRRIIADMDRRVGRQMRMYRIALGLLQSDLADAMGVTTQQISKIELGEDRLHAGQVYLVAERLGIPVSALFEDEADARLEPLARSITRAAQRLSDEDLGRLSDLARLMNGSGR